MNTELKVVNPLEYHGWDDLLLSQKGYSIFHSSHWARVLHDSYGYKPLYFMLTDQGRLSALVPLMEVESVLTGKRGVSLPFTDYCEPLFSGKSAFQQVMGHVIRYGKKAGWKRIELRSGNGFAPEIPSSSSYYGHKLDIAPGEGHILSKIRENTRRNIKKAMRGVNVTISVSRRPWPISLVKLSDQEGARASLSRTAFQNVYDHLISKNSVSSSWLPGTERPLQGRFQQGNGRLIRSVGQDIPAKACEQSRYVEAQTGACTTVIKAFASKNGTGNEGSDGLKAVGAERLLKYYTYDINSGAFSTGTRISL
jgi:hypothetical protein